jgi:molecular chaperone IbpA
MWLWLTSIQPRIGGRPSASTTCSISWPTRPCRRARIITPPYNIARADEDNYRISVAVAGFTPEEISITAEQNQLTVEGQKRSQQDAQYLYQGISARAFRRTFNLADHVKVKGATFEHGLLEIDLVREVPEAMKPRRIEISTKTGRDGQVLENESAGSPDKKVEQLKRG